MSASNPKIEGHLRAIRDIMHVALEEMPQLAENHKEMWWKVANLYVSQDVIALQNLGMREEVVKQKIEQMVFDWFNKHSKGGGSRKYRNSKRKSKKSRKSRRRR